jgi:indole-3-glycerol phosphate synthase
VTTAAAPARGRPPASRPTAGWGRGVLGEIAARRRRDLEVELAGSSTGELRRRAAAAAPPRPVAERLAAPGLHLIAELKRASPSAGRIAGAGEDLVARARAYERGGAAAISVLCEPHWFNGSVDDLAAIRASVAIPVLAKEFVVDRRQLALLRAAGADLVGAPVLGSTEEVS